LSRRETCPFKGPDWEERFLFDFIKQSCLITARRIQDSVGKVEGLPERSKKKVDFFTLKGGGVI